MSYIYTDTLNLQATEDIRSGQLVSIINGDQLALFRIGIGIGIEAAGVAARTMKQGDVVVYSRTKNTDDIIIRRIDYVMVDVSAAT